MSAVCPACGIAVVPGYVRCPKCHAGLPMGGRAKHSTRDPGGTAVVAKGFPVSAILVAVGVAAAVIVVFELRSDHGKRVEVAAPAVAVPLAATPASPLTLSPAASVAAPAPVPDAAEIAAQNLRAATAALEATLRKERLWGRVEISGARVDVRSGSCTDKAMIPAIEGNQAVLRGAGLTRLRCVEQSGAVVFEHDL